MFLYSLFTFFLLSSMFVLGLALFVIARVRRETLSLYLSIYLAGIAITQGAYAFELLTPDLTAKTFWVSVRYIGSALELIYLPFFILGYVGLGSRIPVWLRVFFSACPAMITLLVVTNPLHYLYYTSTWIDASGPFPMFAKSPGPVYWATQVYFMALFSSLLLFLAVVFVRSRQIYRAQSLVLFLGLAAPLVGDMLFVAGVRPLPYLNLTHFAYMVTGVMFTWAVLRYKMLNLPPIALDTAFRIVPVGILVLDGKNNITDINPVAQAVLTTPPAFRLGQPLSSACPDHPEIVRLVSETLESSSSRVAVKNGERTATIAVEILPLTGEHARPGSRMVLLRDITTEVEAGQIQLEQQRALAALREREQLARDLHDSLGQVMGYIHIETQNALQCLKTGQVEAGQATISRVSDISEKAYADLREFLLGLRQNFSESVDFYTALEKYIGEYSRAYGLPVEIHFPDVENRPILSPASEVQLLRIVQEALSNVRKHASANRAVIRFSNGPGPGVAELTVEDDGAGFDPSVLPDHENTPHLHLGQKIMRERAADIGASLQVFSTPQLGTRVVVRFPIRANSQAPAPLSRLRVLIADDHPLFREGLKNLLLSNDIQVVAAVQNGQEAVDNVLDLAPDIAILDIHMPVLNGIEATRQIKAGRPETRVLILTMAAEDNLLFEAVRAGASGYLLKNLKAGDFLARLEALMRGETPISGELAQRLLSEFAGRSQEEASGDVLSSRQMEILKLMSRGCTYAQIAEQLFLSESTIKYHAAQIMERLHAEGKSEAIAEAVRRGWFERRKSAS